MKSNAHCYSDLIYHIVFCPKFRARALLASDQTMFDREFRHVIWAHEGTVLELAIMPDHVHLLVELPPTAYIPKVISDLKIQTSRYFAVHPFWSRGYYIASIGHASDVVVKTYIRNQNHVDPI